MYFYTFWHFKNSLLIFSKTLQHITLKFFNLVKIKLVFVFQFVGSVCLILEIKFFLFYANEAKCKQEDPIRGTPSDLQGGGWAVFFVQDFFLVALGLQKFFLANSGIFLGGRTFA